MLLGKRKCQAHSFAISIQFTPLPKYSSRGITSALFLYLLVSFANRIDFSAELIEDLRSIVKSTRAMIRTTQGALTTSEEELASKIEIYKQNIDDLIFKARNKHIQNIQYGKLPMEFDYMILNLFTDLDRVSEHCMNISRMILRKKKGEDSIFVYAW